MKIRNIPFQLKASVWMAEKKQIWRGRENKQIDIARLKKQKRRENMLIRNELLLRLQSHTRAAIQKYKNKNTSNTTKPNWAGKVRELFINMLGLWNTLYLYASSLYDSCQFSLHIDVQYTLSDILL